MVWKWIISNRTVGLLAFKTHKNVNLKSIFDVDVNRINETVSVTGNM